MKPTHHLIWDDFGSHKKQPRLFSENPRLTLKQAFAQIARRMPDQSSVIFYPYRGTVSPDIYPFCNREEAMSKEGEEPTHLGFEVLYDPAAVIIHRIRVKGPRSRGIGSAMVASQYPFWQALGVQAVAVKTHDFGAGFYRKLGFQHVASLPEDKKANRHHTDLMRLDLTDPEQKTMFEAALAKAPSLIDLQKMVNCSPGSLTTGP